MTKAMRRDFTNDTPFFFARAYVAKRVFGTDEYLPLAASTTFVGCADGRSRPRFRPLHLFLR
jgi:hypothetical protein